MRSRERLIAKEHEEIWGGNRNVLYLDFGNGFKGVYLYKTHWIIYFKWVQFTVHKLYLNKFNLNKCHEHSKSYKIKTNCISLNLSHQILFKKLKNKDLPWVSQTSLELLEFRTIYLNFTQVYYQIWTIRYIIYRWPHYQIQVQRIFKGHELNRETHDQVETSSVAISRH